MREIKFRAWDKEQKRYFFVESYSSKQLIDKSGFAHPAYVCDVEQFIGLHDKNGEEIYEGDIVRTWVDLGPAGEEEVVTAITIGPWGVNLQKWTFDDSYYPEVIGNIHEATK